ncbi:MAG: outer membrane lipoprotein LolB [Pseudomonadota bacterium]
MAPTKLLLCAALCAMLAACATTAPTASPAGRTVAPYSDSVQLSGRLSVNYQKDGKSESLSGKFTWRQSAERTDVSLASPLGQTIATISVTPGEASLTRSGQPPRVAPDIDTLSAQSLGWSLPVSGLRDWLQGYARQADGARFVATPEHDSVTTADGWRLRFVSWQEGAPATPRPKRIDAERNGQEQADQIALRIVLDAPAQP